MKKHSLRDVFLGMVIMALILGLAVPAFATVANKTLEAHYMDIKLVVDGEEIVPKNEKGKVVEPFTVSGTTYLPIRAIASALGKEVTWDGNTKTVYLGEVPAGAIKDWVGINPAIENIAASMHGLAEFPNTAKAIKETNTTVFDGNKSHLMMMPDGDIGTKIYVEHHVDDDYNGNPVPQIWIVGLGEYYGRARDGGENYKGYLPLLKGIFDDLLPASDAQKAYELMVLNEEYRAIAWDGPSEAEQDAAAEKCLEISGAAHIFDTVVLDFAHGALRIYNK